MYKYLLLAALTTNSAMAYEGFTIEGVERFNYVGTSLYGYADGEWVEQSDEDRP